MPKLKFPQYKVRGKHRDYYVVAFPNYPYMWPNYEKDDREYIIDTDAAGWQQLRYAIAILLQAQDRIIYFPTKNNNRIYPWGDDYENYDMVLTVSGLHFRRSEWVRLRRQLKPANRVQNFALSYKPEEIVAQAEKIAYDWHYWQLEKKMVKKVLGNSAFFCLPEKYYYNSFAASLDCEKWIQRNDLGSYIGKLGWMLPDKCIEKHCFCNEKYCI